MIRKHVEIVSEVDFTEGILVKPLGKLLNGLVKVCTAITLISYTIQVGS